VKKYSAKNHNIVYYDCSSFSTNIFADILNLGLNPTDLREKDLKKLILHFFVEQILTLSKNKTLKNRPVYVVFTDSLSNITSKKYLKNFLLVFKHLKRLLPIPLIMVQNDSIFIKQNGEFTGLNEKISSFYLKDRDTTKLRKYVNKEEYYSLIKTLEDVKNLKYIST